MKKLKRYLALVGLVGWKLWAFLALGTMVMIAIVAQLAGAAIAIIGYSTTQAQIAIGSVTNMPIPKANFYHTDFNLKTNADRSIDMDIPDEAVKEIGQWTISRSEDLVNWNPIYSDYMDRKSATILMWSFAFFASKENQFESSKWFYKAEMEEWP